MIDRDENYYTVALLCDWKQLAELEASNNISGQGMYAESTSLSNNDRTVVENIIQTIETGNTTYMLKDHDYHSDFQRDMLNPLFSLMEYLQQPSAVIINSQLREKVQDLLASIEYFRGIIALKGGPAQYGNGSYIIDFEEDQVSANDICNEIWEKYTSLMNVFRLLS